MSGLCFCEKLLHHSRRCQDVKEESNTTCCTTVSCGLRASNATFILRINSCGTRLFLVLRCLQTQHGYLSKLGTLQMVSTATFLPDKNEGGRMAYIQKKRRKRPTGRISPKTPQVPVELSVSFTSDHKQIRQNDDVAWLSCQKASRICACANPVECLGKWSNQDSRCG